MVIRENTPVVCVDKGDLYTVIGGFAVILVVAMLVNPGLFAHISLSGNSGSTPTETTAVEPVTQVTLTTAATPLQTVGENRTPAPKEPYRIVYTSNPFSYPVIHLPDHMETFGASDINPDKNMTPFAYIEESRGGITQEFSVPYDTWAMNISVTADRRPQYAVFRMVLCDATGSILTGAKIQYPGTMYKTVHGSGSGLYMIISTDNVDSFRITLETPTRLYEKDAGSSS